MTSSLATVLRAVELGEADRLCIVYTNTTGKILVKAKGIRKIGSKLAGHIGLLTVSDIVTVPGRELSTLTAASIVEDYRVFAQDSETLWHAAGFLELIDVLSGEGVRDDRVWDLMLAFFHSLAHGVSPSHAEVEAGFRLMCLLGWTLRLDACVHCHVSLHGFLPGSLDVVHGGAVCGTCERSIEHLLAVDARTIRTLQSFVLASFPVVAALEDIRELRTLLAASVGVHTDKGFKAFLRHCS